MARYESEGTWFGEEATQARAIMAFAARTVAEHTAKAMALAPSWDDIEISFGGKSFPVQAIQYEYKKPPFEPPLHITPPLIRFTKIDMRWSQLRIDFWVNDREQQSREIQLTYTENLPFEWSYLTRDARVAWIRQRMICVATHEIDEALFISGLAPDPHLKEINCK